MDILVFCPHCKIPILIEQLNCRIFRHGIFKKDGKQINPHESKEMCDLFFSTDQIYGCGKPFFVNDEIQAIVCDYI